MLAFLLVAVAMTAASRYVMSRPPAPSWQENVIAAVEHYHGDFPSDYHPRLIDGAQQACTMAEEFTSLPDMHDELVRYGFSSDLAISLIAAGLVYHCPEFQSEYEEMYIS
jgi:hypothetical protein